MTERTYRGRLEQQVIERAAGDPQFRRDFMSNPRGTAEREFGVTIPDGIAITVVEETPSSVYVVLPAAPAQAGTELSDADLESVAGGWSGPTECGTCHCQGHDPLSASTCYPPCS